MREEVPPSEYQKLASCVSMDEAQSVLRYKNDEQASSRVMVGLNSTIQAAMCSGAVPIPIFPKSCHLAHDVKSCKGQKLCASILRRHKAG